MDTESYATNAGVFSQGRPARPPRPRQSQLAAEYEQPIKTELSHHSFVNAPPTPTYASPTTSGYTTHQPQAAAQPAVYASNPPPMTVPEASYVDSKMLGDMLTLQLASINRASQVDLKQMETKFRDQLRSINHASLQRHQSLQRSVKELVTDGTNKVYKAIENTLQNILHERDLQMREALQERDLQMRKALQERDSQMRKALQERDLQIGKSVCQKQTELGTHFDNEALRVGKVLSNLHKAVDWLLKQQHQFMLTRDDRTSLEDKTRILNNTIRKELAAELGGELSQSFARLQKDMMATLSLALTVKECSHGANCQAQPRPHSDETSEANDEHTADKNATDAVLERLATLDENIAKVETLVRDNARSNEAILEALQKLQGDDSMPQTLQLTREVLLAIQGLKQSQLASSNEGSMQALDTLIADMERVSSCTNEAFGSLTKGGKQSLETMASLIGKLSTCVDLATKPVALAPVQPLALRRSKRLKKM